MPPQVVLEVGLSGGNTAFVIVIAAIAAVAVAMSIVFRREVLTAAEGTDNMKTIALAVQEGAAAFLGRQFRTLGVFAVIAFALLFLLPVHGAGDNAGTLRVARSVAFVVGAGFSGLIGYLGMWLAVRANLRVAAAARLGGRDVAMHIAAFSPTVLTRDEIDADTVASERRIAEETAKEEGKPEAALPKIVEGRVNGFFKENVLLDQPFAKDAKKTVAKVLEEAGANATQFARFRVGS